MEANLRLTALLNSTAIAGFANGWTCDTMLERSHDSKEMLDHWDTVDAVLDGVEGMRRERERFLPRFSDEEAKDYEFRLKCTEMTNVYSDIVGGLAGKPFEEMTRLDGSPPTEIIEFIEDVDGAGNNLHVFAAHTFYRGINDALAWIFVDFTGPTDRAPQNRAEEKAMNMRPYWSHILARNVIEVQSKMVNSEEVLTYFKVFEPGKVDHVREFIRDDAGLVTWVLYEKRETARKMDGDRETHFWPISGGTISIGVIPMVPFITGMREGRTWCITPPLKAALEKQVEVYQGESDLKFAKKLTAFPMLAANGIVPEKGPDGKPKKLAVGPNRVLWGSVDSSTGKSGNWAYVEPNAESLKFLASENKEARQELRELGKQPLTAQSGNITVITAMVAAGKAKSAVKGWALVLKDALENALVMTAKWIALLDYDPEVYVNTNFDDYSEGEDLDALDKARARKDISQETYLNELQRRGVLSNNLDIAAERQRALDEMPGDSETIDPLTQP